MTPIRQSSQPDRREFLKTVAVSSAVAASPALAAFGQTAQTAGRPYKKAVKFSMVRTDGSVLDKFRLLKRLGFDGVEINNPDGMDAEEVVRARDKSGVPVHGVVDSVHWKQPLSHPDPAVRAAGVAGLERALRAAKRYGASSVLLVPAVVDKQVSYADAYQRSQTEIRKVLPLAEQLEIPILLENVWNNFLLSPLETARYIDEFDSPLVGVYFDVGNVVRYGWPEHWIRTLGKRIGKLDIKEFSRSKADNEGTRKGFQVELLEGDCDWPAVMDALREIGYQGWGTAEIPGGDEARLGEIAARMDRIFAS